MSSEPQTDLNHFNSWDCFGASLMLTMVPAIMFYVFTPEHETGTAILVAIIGVIISLVILALSLITRWRIIGTLVNLVGIILAHLYVAIAIYAWWPTDKDEQPATTTGQQQTEQPAQPK